MGARYGDRRFSAIGKLPAEHTLVLYELLRELLLRELWSNFDSASALSISEIAGSSNPADVMRARLIIEPEIAREAALHATIADIAAMRHDADADETSRAALTTLSSPRMPRAPRGASPDSSRRSIGIRLPACAPARGRHEPLPPP